MIRSTSDLLRDDEHRACVSELKVIEPALYLAVNPRSRVVLADAIEAELSSLSKGECVMMSFWIRLVSIIGGLAGLLALNACSGGSSPFAPPDRSAPLTVAKPAPLASDAVAQVFVSSRGCGFLSCVEGFTKDGRYVATLNGLTNPLGLAFDKRGNLYVADFGNRDVAVYPPGATSPSRTISDPDPGGPYLVAVDSHDDVWMTNTFSWSHHFHRRDNSENIMEFTNRGYFMEAVSCPRVNEYDGGLAIDSKGNAFFQGQIRGHGKTSEVVEEIPHGKLTCKILHTESQGVTWGGLALTSTGNLVVGSWQTNEAITYAAPLFTKIIARTSFANIARLHAIALTKDDREIWIANERNSPEALLYRYPDAKGPLVQIVGHNAGGEQIAINY